MLIWMHGKKAPSSEADEPKYVCMNSHVVQLGIWVVLAAGNVLSCCRGARLAQDAVHAQASRTECDVCT